jgi:hypothetical protein
MEQGSHRPDRRRRVLQRDFGGGGTSLALIGAHVRAGELSRTDDTRAALIAYEASMRPFVDATPPVRISVPRRANPHTRSGIRALHAGARTVTSPAGRAAMKLLGKRLVHVAADDLRLPEYDQPTPRLSQVTSPVSPPPR